MNKKEKIKDNRGGTRPGSGAKSKYGTPTKTIAFRIPITAENHIKELVQIELEKLKLK
jgi:hypothetical protein